MVTKLYEDDNTIILSFNDLLVEKEVLEINRISWTQYLL
jgi:hypothetical protein